MERDQKRMLRHPMMLSRTILGVLVAMIGGCAFGQSACTAHTPEQALPAGWQVKATQTSLEPSRVTSNWFRLDHVVLDPALHRRWAFIANCAHPEWPLQVVALTAGPSAPPYAVANPRPAPQAASFAAERVPRQGAPAQRAISTPPSPQFQTTRTYAQSPAPISSSTAPLIRAGDLVHLWSSDANVRLEIEVVALEYGHAGQIIHLRRLGQSSVLAGVVVGKNSAELMP